MALSTVFHSINSPDNSPLSHSFFRSYFCVVGPLSYIAFWLGDDKKPLAMGKEWHIVKINRQIRMRHRVNYSCQNSFASSFGTVSMSLKSAGIRDTVHVYWYLPRKTKRISLSFLLSFPVQTPVIGHTHTIGVTHLWCIALIECPRGHTLTWWGCCGLCFQHKPTELSSCSLLCSCVYFCLDGPLHCI